MSTKKRKAPNKQDEDEDLILGRFLDFAEGRGVDEFARFLLHCGIDQTDIDFAGGDIPRAILEHYRCADGQYDVSAAANDWFRWPPFAARVKELKRELRQKEASNA